MTSELYNYIMAEANSDWIIDNIAGPHGEDHLCEFVKRMVIDALAFKSVAEIYLREE